MWRIHLNTDDDFARVRLARGADPMWEIVHSLQILATEVDEVTFGSWRRAVIAAGQERWRPLCTLAPPHGYFPDFLTPVPGVTDPREGVEAVLRTPRERLRHEMATLSRSRCLPAWTASLAQGGLDCMLGLGRRMADYFRATLAEHWQLVRRTVDVELDRLGREMTQGGLAGLLSNTSSILTWEQPVLSLTNKVAHRDIALDGRGLILQPSFFASGDSTIVDLPDKPLVVVYPVAPDLGWYAKEPNAPGAGLRSLVGGTRADALELLAGESRTTSELAAALSVSPATVSQHTKVLREAGLLQSEQRGRTVVHAASGLGVRLLGA